MTPYLVVILLGIPLSSLIAQRFRPGRARVVVSTSLACIGLFALQALRDPAVGRDIGTYALAYKDSRGLDFLHGDRLLNFELGYSLYSQFFARYGLSAHAFFGLTAVFILILVGITVAKYSKMPALSMFFYSTLGFYAFSFSGLRQAMAVAICFWAFRYIRDRKPFRFVAVVLLAAQFHLSAWAFLPAYWIYLVPASTASLALGIVGICFVFLFRSEIFGALYVLYRDVPAVIQSTGAGAFFLVLILVWLAVFIFVWSRSPETRGSDELLRGSHNFLYVAVLFQALAGVSPTVGRTGYYYLIFVILLIPEVLSSEQVGPAIRHVAVAFLAPLCIYFFYLQANSLDLLPYQFFKY